MHGLFSKELFLSNKLKLIKWVQLILFTGGTQVLIQVLGFISGILVIRMLPTNEYAFYTLANTALGTMTVLADGGVATGVMSQGGKVWRDREKLGSIIKTGMNLRQKFAIVSLLIAVPLLVFLLKHHNASWLMAVLITLSLIPVFITSLSGTLLEIAPKLHQDVGELQKNQILSNIARLGILSSTIFIFPWAFLAILASSFPQIWINIRLRKLSSKYCDLNQKRDLTVQREVLTIVKRVLPGAIYYCLYGQITVFIISIFGTTTAVAQLGALGRITMALSVISTMFNVLVVPRIARLEGNSKKLLTTFYKVQIGIALVAAFVILSVYVCSDWVLYVLGEKYAGLNFELFLMTLAGCVSMMVALTHSMSNSRGWVLPPSVNISISILLQIILLFVLNLSNLVEVLCFSIANHIVAYILIYSYFIFKAKATIKKFN